MKRWWLWGVPVAWITSALVLFAEDARAGGLHGWGDLLDLARFAIVAAWCGLAWKHLASAGSSRFAMRFATRTVVWLTILGLPLHGYAAVAKNLRGPAHFHGAAADHGSRHQHGHVERHFHTHDQGAIEVDDGDRHHETKTADAGKNGSLSGFDTQSPAHFRALLRRPAVAVSAGEFRAAAPPFPGRLERPPATAAIPQSR